MEAHGIPIEVRRTLMWAQNVTTKEAFGTSW